MGPDKTVAAQSFLDRVPADEYPALVELTIEHVMSPGYDDTAEFERGLDVILDALERMRDGASAGGAMR